MVAIPSIGRSAESQMAAPDPKLMADAEQGDTAAQMKLGFEYAAPGPLLDETRAFYWFHKAAKQGDADAQVILGLFLLTGHGSSQDSNLAQRFFRQAAEQGNDFGRELLLPPSFVYAPDDGQDEIALKRNAQEAYWKLVQADIVTQNDMHGSHLFEDDATFKEYSEAAQNGSAAAQFNLGLAYRYGHGCPESRAESIKWFKKAAENGDPHAELALASLYKVGKDLPQDNAEAFRWARKAAEQGIVAAQATLGEMYFERGKSEPTQSSSWLSCNIFKCSDLQEAYAWMSVAATAGPSDDAAAERDKIGQLLAADALVQAQKLATKYLAKYGQDKSK